MGKVREEYKFTNPDGLSTYVLLYFDDVEGWGVDILGEDENKNLSGMADLSFGCKDEDHDLAWRLFTYIHHNILPDGDIPSWLYEVGCQYPEEQDDRAKVEEILNEWYGVNARRRMEALGYDPSKIVYQLCYEIGRAHV